MIQLGTWILIYEKVFSIAYLEQKRICGNTEHREVKHILQYNRSLCMLFKYCLLHVSYVSQTKVMLEVLLSCIDLKMRPLSFVTTSWTCNNKDKNLCLYLAAEKNMGTRLRAIWYMSFIHSYRLRDTKCNELCKADTLTPYLGGLL